MPGFLASETAHISHSRRISSNRLGAPFLAFFARSGVFGLSPQALLMFIRHRHDLAFVRRVSSCPSLKRYYGAGSLHFITWSCYRRKPLLGNSARRDLVLTVIELMRVRYRFAVIGYVVMPEHVHLLISEPFIGDPSKIIQAVKLSVSRRLAIAGESSGRFWQSRFYDFNLWSQQKEVEKLKYMHRNPVVRGLVASPEDWRWSSYRSYAYGEAGLVRINDWTWWEEKIRWSAG